MHDFEMINFIDPTEQLRDELSETWGFNDVAIETLRL